MFGEKTAELTKSALGVGMSIIGSGDMAMVVDKDMLSFWSLGRTWTDNKTEASDQIGNTPLHNNQGQRRRRIFEHVALSFRPGMNDYTR